MHSSAHCSRPPYHHTCRWHWRKSSQWFVLTRPHAQLVLADTHLAESFHRYCYQNFTRGWPTCVSDEHYLPTLLATYRLDTQADCIVSVWVLPCGWVVRC